MSELISYHLEDGIATLTLSNGKVNAISPDVIAAFNSALDQAVQDKAIDQARLEPNRAKRVQLLKAVPARRARLMTKIPWNDVAPTLPTRSVKVKRRG